MKYLKTYESGKWYSKEVEDSIHKQNELLSEIAPYIQGIKDILLELKDDGFSIEITPSPIDIANLKSPSIYVKIILEGYNSIEEKSREEFIKLRDQAMDGYHRVKEYMRMNGYTGYINRSYGPVNVEMRFEKKPDYVTESKKYGIRFDKQPQKKGAKTDTYNVIKGGKTIGQVKWSSRMRGYAFLPTPDCDKQIKEFVKDLMRKRREKK